MPSVGVDPSACFLLGRGRRFSCEKVTTRLESRPRRGYALSVAGGLVSPLRARAQFCCARGVPTKLAPAHVTRVSTLRRRRSFFRVMLRWGPRDPNIQLLPYVLTHGHTRRSSRSSSARSCRFCPRCRPAFGLAPWCRPIPGRHDRPREEPCLLQGRLRPISRSSLSRSTVSFAAGAVTRGCRPRIGLGVSWSAPGLADTRHGSRPQSEGSVGDSRQKMPLLRETADTPCRPAKAARLEVLSVSEPVRPGGRWCFREYLDLGPTRLREENESC